MTRWLGALALACVSCGGLTTESSGEPTAPVDTDLMLEAGLASSCALEDGELVCWGALDYSLENWDAPSQVSPRKVLDIPGEILEVSSGGYHWCARTADQSAWCWGMNNQGQVGGWISDYESPMRIESLVGQVAAVRVGTFNTCVLTLEGEVYCWGFTGHGVVPGGPNEAVAEPRLIPGLGERVVQIEVGYRRACALTESGAVKCWGHEALEDHAYDDPDDFQVVTLPNLEVGVVKLLPMRERLFCSVMVDGTVRCSGISFMPLVVPSQVVEIPGVADVVGGGAGFGFACFVNSVGRVACFGRADYGQLGVEPPAAEFVPELQFPEIDSVQQISVGAAHVCVKNLSGAYCWGSNESAQLGKQGPKFEWQPQALDL